MRDYGTHKTTAQSLPGVKNADVTKFLLVLSVAFRPKHSCVSAETDNRFARSGFPFRAVGRRKLKSRNRSSQAFFLSARFLLWFTVFLSVPAQRDAVCHNKKRRVRGKRTLLFVSLGDGRVIRPGKLHLTGKRLHTNRSQRKRPGRLNICRPLKLRLTDIRQCMCRKRRNRR